VPVDVLAAREGVEVDDRVETVLGALGKISWLTQSRSVGELCTYDVDHTVQVLQPLLLEHARVHVVLKVVVVDPNPDQVEPHVPDRLGVCFGEEVLEELITWLPPFQLKRW
jgi:hypothetical protein